MLEPANRKKQATEHSPTGKTCLPWTVWFFRCFSGLTNCEVRMGYKKTDPFFSPLFSLGPAKKRGARVKGAGCPLYAIITLL